MPGGKGRTPRFLWDWGTSGRPLRGMKTQERHPKPRTREKRWGRLDERGLRSNPPGEDRREHAGFAVPGKARFSVVMLVVGGDRQHIGTETTGEGESPRPGGGPGGGSEKFF